MLDCPAGHDERLLDQARRLVNSTVSPKEIRAHLYSIVKMHEQWRGTQCINLIAAEAQTSREVRQLLTSDLGCRASGGHIGAENRFFAGLDEADRLEALCISVLTDLFSCARADPRLLGGMHATTVTYAVLKRYGDTVMSLPEWGGGDTSNRQEGPPGVLGYQIHDIPVVVETLDIDLDQFEEMARRIKPAIVALGASVNLFPYPVSQIKDIIEQWGGILYFDGAHQAGLIAGKCYPNPLEGKADILSGSTGKTLSGPQGGLLCWNDDRFTGAISEMIFPVLTGTHQLNRVAALTLAALELQEFGQPYMAQMVSNAQALGRSLEAHSLTVLGSERNYTQTHQVVIDVGDLGGGHKTARKLAKVGIIANKAMLPVDRDTSAYSGLRFGTAEVTRLGMKELEMDSIGRQIAEQILDRRASYDIEREVRSLRKRFDRLLYCWD